MKDFLKDDAGNKSITRLMFFITSIFIMIYCLVLFIIPINLIHYQLIITLIAWNLALIGIKNWKDIINKK
jgi:hypothetical protein